ncbi:50S ribosomal protein L13 [Microcoleus sp. LEGE 07076]|uniref:50S ribosomal protein L13 n=1 Tax=Microcoleus sp. LEGE 07076 TaxID=915322 RepID=UPI00187EEE68|nr:50S ribosomal protein L13 [Microcoleus sp. LEGE 07076]MBE9185575.1 50S ribosomal protein L13 [Microcoleus sp. LEGE 07076]
MNKSYVPTQDSLEHKWYVVDAADQRLGRLATEVATYLRGKHKPTYTPSMDTGDFVIVINADKIAVTGKKRTQKIYRRHSGRPGGMKTETFAKLQARLPERIVEEAIRGMLPHTSLGRQLFTKLKVYAGPNHPHAAQKPEELIVHTIPGGNE